MKEIKKRKKKNKHIKIDLDSDLTLKMELFCNYYLFGGKLGSKKFILGNATMSYALAFGIEIKDKKRYQVAQVSASELLLKPIIKKRMRKILYENGFNNDVVDSRLFDIVKTASPKDSNVAIKTFNELQKRIETTTNVVIVDQDKKGSLNKALEYLNKK